MNSDQVLHGMHKVLAHDLPNQMVVLQSLLQLLDQEESARLSDDGREYVRRLQSATRRASDLARFLKEMERVHVFPCKSEPIALVAMARELQGELRRLHPGRQFEFDWQWSAPAVVGDTRVFLQALTELVAGLLHPAGKRCRLSAGSREHGDAIELAFHLEEAKAPSGSIQALSERIEVILAREWLALCGASVAISSHAEFRILVPKR